MRKMRWLLIKGWTIDGVSQMISSWRGSTVDPVKFVYVADDRVTKHNNRISGCIGCQINFYAIRRSLADACGDGGLAAGFCLPSVTGALPRVRFEL
jgi:hypothetical protein